MSVASFTTRLAPSPTGAQHLGNARSYLIAWLAARSQGGRVVLRIEDIDSPRIKPGSVRSIFDDLRWLGLDWDGEPVVQTARLPHYQAALDRLIALDRVYPCTCTRTDIERASSAPHAGDYGHRYPGTCAHRQATDQPSGPFAYRFRAVTPTPFADEFRGLTTIPPAEWDGDFVVWKSAGTPAYQLAVVVDDAEFGVSDVIRGDDLVPSTPRQLQLYDALGLSPPRFWHVPLVVGPDGRRLAKRHGDTRLSTFRDAGVPAEALLGRLAHSCGWLAGPEPITARELVPLFRWSSIPRTPWVVS